MLRGHQLAFICSLIGIFIGLVLGYVLFERDGEAMIGTGYGFGMIGAFVGAELKDLLTSKSRAARADPSRQ